MSALEQIRRDLWQAGRTDALDAIQALTYAFEHLHELSEAAHAVNQDSSDEGAWMFLSGECHDYESPGVPELSNSLAAALRLYGNMCAAQERERCAKLVEGWEYNARQFDSRFPPHETDAALAAAIRDPR